ncbi:MAG TPA: sugar kinase [Firmicutes bacterium]|jgi:glucokinase-like ROK family protein|nr:sugar kinase [Bacillota bacterium]
MKNESFEKNPVFGWFGPAAGAAIFKIIKSSGPLSRAEIVRETGLSKSTVSMHVDKLIKIGLVKEEHNDRSGAGRKGLLLSFAIDSGYIIGIDLGASSLNVALCNLNAGIIDFCTEELFVYQGPEKVMERICYLTDQLLAKYKLERVNILGIGMGVPGPVEFETGIPVSPPIMPGWHHFPVKKTLMDYYGCPVYVDNDVNVMAYGERYSGWGKNIDNFIFIKVGTGIGAGIFCDGKLYRGSQGCAGDIGHIGVDGNTTPCYCGNKGCLEIIAAGPAIGNLAKEAAEAGKSFLLAEKLKEQGFITAKDVGMLAEHGDLACVDLIQKTGQTIGQVLAKLINFFNPSLVVIGGGVTGLGGRFLAAIKEVVYRRSLPLATRELSIQNSSLGESTGMIGAAAMALNEVFSHNNVTEMVSLENSRLIL